MEFINRMRKDKKGFTLVEIIVVLVILAILAAFMIPSMLGFVNEAKGKALLAEAREVYVAAQATATQYDASTDISTTGLQSALGSKLVSGQASATSAPAALSSTDAADATKVETYNKSCASYQMSTYLKNDLTASSADAAAKTEKSSYWTVTLNGAQVTSVSYTKNGYTITLTEPAGTSTITAL